MTLPVSTGPSARRRGNPDSWRRPGRLRAQETKVRCCAELANQLIGNWVEDLEWFEWPSTVGLPAALIIARTGLTSGQVRGALVRLVRGGYIEKHNQVELPQGSGTAYVLSERGARLIMWAADPVVAMLGADWPPMAARALEIVRAYRQNEAARAEAYMMDRKAAKASGLSRLQTEVDA